jgi:homoserine acetyltransferase
VTPAEATVQAARDALLATAGQLEAQAAVLRALAAEPVRLAPEANGGEWLRADEAGLALGVSRNTILRRTIGQAFRRQVSPRVIRFERGGLERWWRRQASA